ncbi:integral membrane protein 2A-like [Plodia interpunctella]|uniref:integral membrane protein 2A-like n=1 Tax=Plodia interpunctella TaxID=58824 RepID=UPI0023676DB5|nr:integral membrane protein 2A-like [Plodia interpunctella]
MTVLTKQSRLIKKEEVSEAPLVHEKVCDEEKIDIHPGVPVAWVGRRASAGLMCLTLMALFMASVGIVTGLVLYRQYLRTAHRYQGICSIPINEDPITHVRWRGDPDVPMLLSPDEDNNETEDTLVERFDIGDNYEKVLVLDSGRNFEFIHDFTVNLTAIVDDTRCFMMSLDPSILLPPEQLMLGLRSGARFDVSRVRSALRADLRARPPPPTASAFLLLDACLDKPTYMLKMDDTALVRKRSASEPPREFIQFSGKHVQEIEIGNMAELLQYEKNLGRPGAPAAAEPAPARGI